MHINIIEVLESIKESCGKHTTCERCRFAGSYRHKGHNAVFYYCRIADTPSDWQIDSGSDVEIMRDVNELIKDMPAPKIGRWIGIGYDGYADGYPVIDEWECSECGWEHSGEDYTLTCYCPNCGVKMEGVNE